MASAANSTRNGAAAKTERYVVPGLARLAVVGLAGFRRRAGQRS